MAKRKVHWHPPSAAVPRARCGAWMGTALVSRDDKKVTCRRCRNFMVQAELALEPMRGRPMEVTYKDGTTERGQLIDAARAGLELCRLGDGKRVLAEWPRVERADFLDNEPAEGEPLGPRKGQTS